MPQQTEPSQAMHSGLPTPHVTRLTRHEFYKLAERCHSYALELARYDQTRVNLKQCHEFNRWLAQVKLYDLLKAPLQPLKPARPVARWQLLVLGIVLGVVLFAMLSERATQSWITPLFYSYVSLLVIFYFVPERFYGTTIELLEGKLLRVVDTLEALLVDNQLGFTEAAFFQTKANLEAARRELRQQIDLAHRN